MTNYVLVAFASVIFSSCVEMAESIFLSKNFVSLREDQGMVIVRNSTSDSLKLAGSFFNNLPYSEKTFTITLASGEQDTLKFNFAFPDFIHIDEPHYFRVFNAPGKILHAEILSISATKADVKFRGDFGDINDYYLAHHNKMGWQHELNRPYYLLADTLDDFNQFPQHADSITDLSLRFLSGYVGDLPLWFKKHETWRLKYLGGFLKYNTLFSKRFYSGEAIPVSNDYYSFSNDLPLNNTEMILNSEYLMYTNSFISELRHKTKINCEGDLMMCIIDSLTGVNATRDILKMQRLSMLHRQSTADYRDVLSRTLFVDPANKSILDSLIKVKRELPRTGEPVPPMKLVNLDGEKVLLSEFLGHRVIINFWATWCGPCIKEFPFENQLHQRYKDMGLVVVNVCVDSDKDKWKKVSVGENLSMVNRYVERDQFRKLHEAFGLGELPKSIVLDQNMRVSDNNFKRASTIDERDIKRILGGK
ncbi:MAG: TlpA family protein disulfide reductase [Bacteroidota bacterium]